MCLLFNIEVILGPWAWQTVGGKLKPLSVSAYWALPVLYVECADLQFIIYFARCFLFGSEIVFAYQFLEKGDTLWPTFFSFRKVTLLF